MSEKKASDVIWHRDANHGVIGERIVVDARQISDIRVINRSGRHKAQTTVLRDDARAWIEIPRKTAMGGGKT